MISRVYVNKIWKTPFVIHQISREKCHWFSKLNLHHWETDSREYGQSRVYSAACSSISWAREQLKFKRVILSQHSFSQSEGLHAEFWPMRSWESCLVNNCAVTPILAQSSSQNKLFTLRLGPLFTQTFLPQSRPMRGQYWAVVTNQRPDRILWPNLCEQ